MASAPAAPPARSNQRDHDDDVRLRRLELASVPVCVGGAATARDAERPHLRSMLRCHSFIIASATSDAELTCDSLSAAFNRVWGRGSSLEGSSLMQGLHHR
eukprot:7183713-Prymnesium_polylepis.1